jgi:hypothetical protein
MYCMPFKSSWKQAGGQVGRQTAVVQRSGSPSAPHTRHIRDTHNTKLQTPPRGRRQLLGRRNASPHPSQLFIVIVGVHVLQSMVTVALVHSRVNTPELGAVS